MAGQTPQFEPTDDSNGADLPKCVRGGYLGTRLDVREETLSNVFCTDAYMCGGRASCPVWCFLSGVLCLVSCVRAIEHFDSYSERVPHKSRSRALDDREALQIENRASPSLLHRLFPLAWES